MIRMAVVGALILAVGTSSAVAGIMLSHASLARKAAVEFKGVEFKKTGEAAQKVRPPALQIMNAGNWSAWWHS